jgi:hypothetical protein
MTAFYALLRRPDETDHCAKAMALRYGRIAICAFIAAPSSPSPGTDRSDGGARSRREIHRHHGDALMLNATFELSYRS